MSKKKFKKERQRRRFPWSLAAIGGALLVISAFLFANQGSGGTPSVTVDQQRIDYGDVKFNVPKTFALQVTNTGDGTLKFKEKPYIQVLEGC